MSFSPFQPLGITRNQFTNLAGLAGMTVLTRLGNDLGVRFAKKNARVSLESPDLSGLIVPQQFAYPFTPTKTMVIRKRKSGKGKRKVATVAAVKKMISGVLEKKQLGISKTIAPAVGSKNAVHTENVTAKIVQGTADGQRVGDAIHLTTLTFAFTAIANSLANYYKYRLIVGWSGEEYNPGTWATGSMGTGEVFQSTFTDAVNAIVNTKAFSPIYDQIIDVNSYINGFADGVTARATIKLDSKFLYQAAGSVYGKTRNLYILMVPFFNTGAPTDCGGLQIDYVIKFTDA